MCRRCLRRPWRLRWILVGLSGRGGALVKRFELVGTLSKSGLVPKAGHVGGCEWQTVYVSMVRTLWESGNSRFWKEEWHHDVGKLCKVERGCCNKSFLYKSHLYVYKTMSILASSSRPNLGKLTLWG